MTPKQIRDLRKVRLIDFAPGDIPEERLVQRLLQRHLVEGSIEWFHDSPEARAVVEECFTEFRAKAQAVLNNALAARKAERLKFAERTMRRLESEQKFAEQVNVLLDCRAR